MIGKQVCYHHGGNSRSGMSSPTIKHGRYSKVLPARLLPSYEAAQQDRDLLDLSAEIHVTDSRIADVLAKVDTGESGALWQAVKGKLVEFQKARTGGKVPEMTIALEELEKLIERGLADYAAWADVRALFQERRRLVESERKRMLEMQQYVAVEKALLLVQALADSVKQHVTDPATLAAIQRDITRLITAPASR